MAGVHLLTSSGTVEYYTLAEPRELPKVSESPLPRVAYAAAHVVRDPLVAASPMLDAAIDWDATLAYRRHLWGLGLGVAEAMDTAQRGTGLPYPAALELMRRSIAEARDFGAGARLACGVGTDHLLPAAGQTVEDVIAAYDHQCEAVESAGGRIIVMASRALAACAKGPADYLRVYDHILSQVSEPVILHWLGEVFDPALAGYWGYTDHDRAMEVCLDLIRRHAARIDGIKISLLSAGKEIAMRRRLPDGVRMYTGDDFNYAELIAGDGEGWSHALLGIFDPIAAAASAALAALGKDDRDRYDAILAPTVPLSRHIFESPTRFYKTGVVFMAYLNGHQDHFTLLGGQESARSAVHLSTLVRLADQAGLFTDPERAAQRAARVMAAYGVGV